jgi:hypothetical protein
MKSEAVSGWRLAVRQNAHVRASGYSLQPTAWSL